MDYILLDRSNLKRSPIFDSLNLPVRSEPIDYNIRGFIKPGWGFVRDIFRDNFVQERDLGASVAAYHQGSLVFELGGGWFDQSQTKPYDINTLQLVFSTTKGLVAAAVALAVQQGLLDYSALVTKYWPEYGQNGKENTKVSDILSHRAGLPDINEPFEMYVNWTVMIHKLEKMAPSWPPGSAYGYHALTYGWLAGELIRRVDPKKRSLGQFVKEEISDLINIDFSIGLPENREHLVSPLVLSKAMTNGANGSDRTIFTQFNDPRVHRAEIPGANGIATAWSIARLYSGLIGDLDNGGFKRILNEDTLKLATRSNTPKDEIDLSMQMQRSFAMGFLLYDDILPQFGPNSFGHGGFGGSIGFCAPSKNFSFAFAMNRLDVESVNDQRIGPMLNRIAEYLS
ncbi:unnamed protein product [Rotaria magnacalcarata]|uniref:Beta-lactamase-related domain-containing protein n=2 Tax=Rotaria magnacalcarata TaxID=392030 RepID=A0A819J8R9_9BILA|nr:unnamed protein product [Rotaria magnacalcarata]CAF3925123.1 unnamed protein product [Rotaria magnacalcarata]